MKSLPAVGRVLAYAVIVLLMIVPLYLLVVNSFKDQQAILSSPLSLPISNFSWQYILQAAANPRFNILKSYLVTVLLALGVNALSVAVCGPASYALARGMARWHQMVRLFLMIGLFIPSQVILIPAIYVLHGLHLMGTIPGLLLFQTTAMIPTTVFLFTAYVQSLPRELDEAAKIDGASRFGTFWQVIFPLMRPAVATAVVLNTINVWCDFVTPRIILGPASTIRTVTTGIYASISKYTTDFTVVFPSMLLAVVPAMIFYVMLQKQIIGGLAGGAVKG